MSLKTKLIAALEQGYQQQIAFVESLPAELLAEVGTREDWTAKDVAAHVTVWSQRLIDDVDRLSHGEALPVYDHDDEENEGIYAEYQHASWETVRRLMADTQARFLAYLRAVEEEVLSDPTHSPWQDGRPAWQRIVGSCLTHVLLHLAAYDVAHGRSERAIQSTDALVGVLLSFDDSPSWRGVTFYNQACLYALAGHPDQAVSKLREALELNPGLTEWSREDTDLISLHNRPDYQALYSA